MDDKLYSQRTTNSEEDCTLQNEDTLNNLTRDFHPLDFESDHSLNYQGLQRCAFGEESFQSEASCHRRQQRSALGSGKPPRGPVGGCQIVETDDAGDIKQVYKELQHINVKLKDEFEILNKRSQCLKKKEQQLEEAESQIASRVEAEIQERMAARDQQIALALQKAETLLKEKVKENQRLQQNFNTLKVSNETLKKELDSLQHQHEKLEKQSQSLQARLINLQRKQQYEDRKDANLPPDLPKVKQPPQKDSREKQHKGKVHGIYDVMSTLLEWVSEFHLRQAISDQPTKQTACPTDVIQDKTLKTFPLLVEILKEAATNNSKFVLPCLQYMYWSLLHLEQGKVNQRSALSSTLRRLGEELYRPKLLRPSEDTERPPEGFFFQSQNIHVQFLSSLLILKTVIQVDHLAHVFDVLRNNLKNETTKELFLHYQATPVILHHLKPVTKTLLNASMDTHLQMSMESPLLPAFLDSCSNESWFRAVANVWKTPNVEHKVLEKLSIILQKLSKLGTNRKYFEVFGLVHSLQEMMCSLGNDHESAFLNLNLKSILFNLNIAKGLA